MATLGEWRGDSTTLLPTTSWAAPNALFSATAERNDSSAYSFDATTSTVTLPASGLADGYLFVGAFEFEDTSNGRHNPVARFVQSSGAGNFTASASSGYNRDTSEDRAYVRTWCFVDSPSASAEIQFQWKRDTDAPTGGTVRSQLQVIPLYYAAHGIYSSSSTAKPGGTTANQVGGWSVVSESSTSAIEMSADVVTVKGDNKRYLCLGGQFWENASGNTRTQRWSGFRFDSSLDNSARAYSYMRNNANDHMGDLFTQVIETQTADRTIDQIVFRGEALGTFPQTGADVDGATTGSSPSHAWVVLELNDNAEVFQSQSDTQQDIDVAGTRVNLQIADTINLNDSASFTGSGTTGVNIEQDMDVLLGANVSGGYASTSTARYTGFAEFTKNGTGETYSFAGDYGRGNQGSIDTWGWSANLLGFVDATTGDDLGVNAGKITGGEGGTVDALGGWVGFWGINLDTLEAGSSAITGTMSAQESGNDTASFSGGVSVSGSLSAQEVGADNFSAAGTVASNVASGSMVAQETGQDTLSALGGVRVSGSLAAQEPGSDTFSAAGGAGVSGTLSVQESGSDSLAASGGVSVSGALSAQEVGDDAFTASGTVSSTARTGSMAVQEAGQDAFSAVGNTPIAGVLLAQEVGGDGFVAAGEIRIGGSLATQESGIDAFAASGAVSGVSSATGTMAAQEGGAAGFQGGPLFQGASLFGRGERLMG